MMEPVEKLKVLAPRAVRGGGEEPLICLVNPSNPVLAYQERSGDSKGVPS